MFEAILGGMISGILLVVLGFLLAGVVYYFSRYRKLLSFFGLTSQRCTFILYLSSLDVLRGGSVDAAGVPRSFAGIALPGNEFLVIPSFSLLFNRFAATPTYTLLRLILQRHWSSRIKTLILPSPLSLTQIRFENTLSLGSPGYNEVTKYHQTQTAPYLQFNMNNGQIEINKGPHTGRAIPNPNNDDLAILEKLFDDSHSVTVFIAAGMGVNGTRGAAEYLLAHWQELSKIYDKRPFAWCLAFPQAHIDPNGWQHPRILERFPDN